MKSQRHLVREVQTNGTFTPLRVCVWTFFLSLFLLPVNCPPALGNQSSSSSDSQTQTAGVRRPRESAANVLQLPQPSKSGGMGIETALSKLYGLEIPSDQNLKLAEIGQLAWAAQGQIASTNSQTPVTDERVLMKVYFVLNDGSYVYMPLANTLQQTGTGDVRATLASALVGQASAPIGGCQVIVCGSSRDFSMRYGSKARNVMLLLAGQMVQNIQLQALSLNLTFVGINNVDIAAARRICRLPREIEPLYAVLVGYPVTAVSSAPSETPNANRAKRAVMIVPQNGFQDAELFETRRALELNSVQVLVASLRAGPIRGMFGGLGQADLPLGQVRVANFDAVIFVGGTGTVELLTNRLVLTIARQAAAQRKVEAASGNAPAILAAAGVVSGARVTGLLDVRDGVVLAGGLYTGNPVEKQGTLITSTGAQVIPLFVQAIMDALNGQ
jgi:protease I